MVLVIRQTAGREAFFTVVVPGLCSLLVGIALVFGLYCGRPYPLRLESLLHYLGLSVNPFIMVAAPALLLSIPFLALQYARSFRAVLGLLGSLGVAAGLSGPVSIAVGTRDWGNGVLELNGLIFLAGPCVLALLMGTVAVYCLRWFLHGWPVVWKEGMCRHCGYSLREGASKYCPECGTATPTGAETDTVPGGVSR